MCIFYIMGLVYTIHITSCKENNTPSNFTHDNPIRILRTQNKTTLLKSNEQYIYLYS